MHDLSQTDTTELRILVVDDEAPITDLLSRFLTQFSYPVQACNNPEMVLPLLADHPIDLVITDVIMPEMNGLKLIERIRKIYPQLPFIVMTGSGDVETAVRAMRLGAVDFLQKPLQFERLKVALKEIELRRLTERYTKNTEMTGTHKLGNTFVHGEDMSGHSIGSYHVIKVIGEGAVGTVFLCRKSRSERLYAVKMLKQHLHGNEKESELTVKRFINEGNAISQLDHPNVIKFFEFGFEESDAGKIPYMVMEYFESRPLKTLLNSPDTMDLQQKISIIRQVASGLEAVHQKKIYHRDIKPGNILIDEHYHAKVTDFGICHLPSSDLTVTDSVMGTPLYMPPENLKKKKVTKTMDIYSLGVVSYELFLGVRPFDAPDFHLLIQKILHDYPIRPSLINPEFPKELEDILARMLKKTPHQRYQSAGEVIQELDDFVQKNRKTGLFDRLKWLTLFSRDWR